jgi:hypothetical protein
MKIKTISLTWWRRYQFAQSIQAFYSSGNVVTDSKGMVTEWRDISGSRNDLRGKVKLIIDRR